MYFVGFSMIFCLIVYGSLRFVFLPTDRQIVILCSGTVFALEGEGEMPSKIFKNRDELVLSVMGLFFRVVRTKSYKRQHGALFHIEVEGLGID